MAAAARQIPIAAAAAQPVFPDEILEEIFLRLDAAADLARASAACPSFRRVVSARRFLRLFRSLHPAPLLGFLGRMGRSIRDDRFFPAEPPHRSASAARALVRAADFTFSFLPEPYIWILVSVRDGRVLLVSKRILDSNLFQDVVVCDPLHHRYVMIPPIPDDLAPASVPQYRMKALIPFLAPAGKDGDEEGSSFRIVSTLLFRNKFIAFVFSSCNQKWRRRSITRVGSSSFPFGSRGFTHYYAHGCIHWIVDSVCYSLMPDTLEMKFISFDLLPNSDGLKCAIVEAGEGRLGLLTLGDGSIDRFSKIWGNNGGGAEDWHYDKTIHLPKDCDGANYHWRILDASERYLPLLAIRRVYHDFRTPVLYFVLDLKTLLLERLCTLTADNRVSRVHLYASFPPPFAVPSI
ncbi:unnamed protein product [Urochloa decumbens]|uniref:F-box domain-containing protein n=1 Tax=Urochloa decumbens TaxID=240449 RepID=A0ABC8VIZ9_9POAL